MSRTRSHSTALVHRGLLAIGFVALAGAVLVAHSTPATGYELSLYTNTPLAFWAPFGCAMLVSLLVSLTTTADWLRRLALVLGGSAAVAFAGLPVLRGYRFHGAGDALTHLGWMRGIQAETFSPAELPYPALHSLANVLSVTFGIDLSLAALLVIVILSGSFFLFVALSTSLVFESRYSAPVGAFSAFLFLPITTLSTFMVPHAMSQAILFSSVILYLMLKYVRGPESLRSMSGVGSLFAIASVALVVYHPQLAAHLLVAFFGICVLQFLYRRYRTGHPITTHRPLYAQTVVLVAAFLAWTSNHGFFRGAIEYAASSAVGFLFGDETAGESVNAQTTSLGELGASVAELFLKLLGSSLVFIGVTGLLILWTIWDSNGVSTYETDGLVPYFTVSLGGLTGVFALYFLGSYGQMYFRVLGLMLLLVTIGGAVAISYGATAFSRNRSSRATHSFVAIGFGILLLVSLVAVFPSPYIYSSSPHITDMSLSGHETAFDNRDAAVSFVGIRAGPNRYADAIRGERERTREHDEITGEEIDDGIAGQFSDDRYLTVTQTDRDREIRAYQELRYSRTQLDSIPEQSGVDRVQSNGEFELFYVRGGNE